MAERLTDLKKKKIISDYISCENYSKVGRKHNVSGNTVKRIVKSDPQTSKKVNQKKEENCKDVIDSMSKESWKFKRFADYFFERLNPENNKSELDSIPISQLGTTFGILADKFLKSKEISKQFSDNEENKTRVVIIDDIK